MSLGDDQQSEKLMVKEALQEGGGNDFDDLSIDFSQIAFEAEKQVKEKAGNSELFDRACSDAGRRKTAFFGGPFDHQLKECQLPIIGQDQLRSQRKHLSTEVKAELLHPEARDADALASKRSFNSMIHGADDTTCYSNESSNLNQSMGKLSKRSTPGFGSRVMEQINLQRLEEKLTIEKKRETAGDTATFDSKVKMQEAAE